MALKNIIFDLGGVIFHIDHSRTQRAFEELGLTGIKEQFSHSRQNTLFDDLETGRITPLDFYDGIRAKTTHGLSDAVIGGAFNSLLIGIPDASYFDILSDVRSKYRTFLLSNNNRIHYNWIIDYMQGRWKLPSLSRFFENEYYSHLVGLRKPGSPIFKLLLDTESLLPQESIFIDDTAANNATASELGIHTYLKNQEQNLGDVLKTIFDRDYSSLQHIT